MKKIRVFEAFAGYGSQAIAAKRLRRDFPEAVDFEFVGISEIEPAAIKAYRAIHGDTPNYGDITKIDWAQVPDFDLFTWSFPCFVAGTLIHTQRGFIPIEDVIVGDMVLTHSNNYRNVLKIGSRNNAPIIKVRGMCFKDITCTPNHPFYVRKRYKQWNNSIRRWERKFADAEWVNAENLNSDSYIGYAINRKSELPQWNGTQLCRGWHTDNVNSLSAKFVNPDFWYVMGRYVGDGWKRQHKGSLGIVICCSDRNKDSLTAAIESAGFNYSVSKERTATRVHICMKELHEFVSRYGYKAYGKLIDEETINLPTNLLKSFVAGYVDADGCFTSNEYKATSVSEKLMYGLQQCISKVYKCPVRMYWCKRKPTTIIEGRTVHQRDSYSLAWHPDKRKQDKAFYEDGYVWSPVKDITTTGSVATVYNMEVDVDNSYTANGAIVHNCTDISNAGKQAGLSANSGTRSSLAWECVKALRVKRPQWALMENVKALTQKKFKDDFAELRRQIEDLGYANYYAVLNAKDHGVPQNRERVFMVSILRTESDPNPVYNFPDPIPLTKTVEDYMEKAEDVDDSYYISQERVTNKVLSDILDQPNVRAEMEKLYRAEWDFFHRHGRFPKDGELENETDSPLPR